MTTARPTSQTSPTIIRGFKLDNTATRAKARVPESSGVTITAELELGSWTTYVLAVQWVGKGTTTPKAFSPAKTIAAGGGSVAITEADLVGVDELVFLNSSGAAEATGATAILTVQARRTVQYTGDVTQIPTDSPMSDAPDPGGEG